MAIPIGFCPTGMVAITWCVVVSKTETLEEASLEINALLRSGVIAIRIGKSPTAIWVTTWLAYVSITATSLEYLAGTQREGADWAKAEDAKAKAKIINNEAARYVFITRKNGLRP